MDLTPWQWMPGIRRSYALRFGVALAVVLLVVGIFGGSIYAHTGSELEETVESQLVTGAETDAERLDIWFQSTERYLESLRGSNEFRNDDHVSISDSLHRMNDRPAFEGAYYVDAETGAVDVGIGDDAVVDEGRLSDAVADQFSAAVDREELVTFSETFETADGRPAMLVVTVVPGDSVHAVVGLVDLESLSRYVIGTDSAEGVVVVDETGTVALSADRSQLLRDDVLDAGSLSGDAGTTSIGPGATDGVDEEIVVGYASLSRVDWTLTTRVPADEAYSLQSDISRRLLAMLGVVFTSVLLLGATVGRSTARSLRTLSERATAIEEGNLDEPVESDRRDELGALHRSVDRMRRSLRERLAEAETARAEAQEARAEAERFSDRLERTADAYGETMRACADGDLTRRLEPDDRSDAMATVAREFNAMMDDLEATVTATRAFADAVDDAAESTADGVVEVRSASEQVTASVQEIADGADRQSDQLAAITEAVDELSTTTREIASTSSQVATLAERTATTSADARESARRAIAGMNAIEDEADDAVAEVDRLEDEFEAIDDLLAFIGDLTQETNVLALNASIEAGRSQSDDAEFTAVAEQVRTLAEDTKEAAADIEERVERIHTQADRVAAVVRETDERIADHRSAVETSVTALDEISEFAAETNDGVQEISAATQQQAAATREVVTMTDDVTAISEETSAEAETVAAAAEEQTSSLVSVARTATSLSERARELSDALSTFEVASEPTAEIEPIGRETDDAALVAEPEESAAGGIDGDATADGTDASPTAVGDDGPSTDGQQEFTWTGPR